jgi:hypothetical protein
MLEVDDYVSGQAGGFGHDLVEFVNRAGVNLTADAYDGAGAHPVNLVPGMSGR